MLAKLEYYYTEEVQVLLYQAAFLDPLHVSKLKRLGCSEVTKEQAM